MQSLLTDYYYTQPLNFHRIMMFPIYKPNYCPTYAPIVKDGICRLCQRDSSNHRKYYIYSNFARKIQLWFINLQFKKFYKNNFQKFKYFLTTKFRPFSVLVMIYKLKYVMIIHL